MIVVTNMRRAKRLDIIGFYLSVEWASDRGSMSKRQFLRFAITLFEWVIYDYMIEAVVRRQFNDNLFLKPYAKKILTAIVSW